MNGEIIISDLRFPEGPVFDFEGNLWFVEIQGGNLSCWNGKNLVRYDVQGTPNGAAIDRQGNLWFCDSGRGEIRAFTPGTGNFSTICDSTTEGQRLKRPNDLIFDAGGNLLFSDHADGRTEPLSTICVLEKGTHAAKVVTSGKYFTNGLALKADGKTLIFAETYRQQLWMADWDCSKLELANERPFAKAGDGPWGPDGLAFDEEENLYVAIFNESKLNVYDREGMLTSVMPCPGSRPTSCAFLPDKTGLVVTEAEQGQVLYYPANKKGLPIFYG